MVLTVAESSCCGSTHSLCARCRPVRPTHGEAVGSLPSYALLRPSMVWNYNICCQRNFLTSTNPPGSSAA
eukprot:6481790-Amphidinium_carterae.2